MITPLKKVNYQHLLFIGWITVTYQNKKGRINNLPSLINSSLDKLIYLLILYLKSMNDEISYFLKLIFSNRKKKTSLHLSIL